jgi:hypothetical protein
MVAAQEGTKRLVTQQMALDDETVAAKEGERKSGGLASW